MPDRVVVIGDLMVDLVVRPSGPLQHASDVASTIRSHGGGSAANTACWLAHAGLPVTLAAMAGDDPMGAAALAELAASGVEVVGEVLAGVSTGTCVLLVDPDGERTMLPDRGANDHLDEATVNRALDLDPAWVHLSGYSLLDVGSRPAARLALQRCRRDDIPVSVDASSAAPIQAVGAAEMLDWIDGCRLLFANDDELAALGGAPACLDRVEAVVAKHGPGGATWLDAAGDWSEPAVAVDVVDTVGAGDALDAGVIAAVLQGGDPATALRRGVELAAAAVAGPGGRPRQSA